jgi:carboxypeptidase C (cathepsin A)
MKHFRRLLSWGFFVLATAGGWAENATTEAKPAKDEKVEAKAAEEKLPPLAMTEHELTLGGKVFRYRATAGYLVLKETKETKDEKEREKPKANVFFIAYTLISDAPVARRPVTFAFNGGPGSSSVWLHLGGLGPKRVVTTTQGESTPPPYQLTDNESTWLGETDLVFIDPVSTGYSRAAKGEDAGQFHGYEEDLHSVGDFIRLYTSRYQRWSSPKFLVGESYGGVRAAGLAEYLQDRFGLYCNGLILVSPALDWRTISLGAGNELAYSYFLPSCAAAAWYHGKLPGKKSLAAVLAEAEAFAKKEYALALLDGDAVTVDERARVAAKLADLTSLPKEYFLLRHLQLDPGRFRQKLLEAEGRGLGRFDARVQGIAFRPGEETGFDPSFEAVAGAFTATLNDYVRGTLKFESDLPYEILADVGPWKTASGRYLNGADSLRHAMITNPALRVWVASGYYDLATPYFTIDRIIHGLNLDPAIRGHIRQTVYASGHMVYTVPSEREKWTRDFREWIAATLSAQSASSSP